MGGMNWKRPTAIKGTINHANTSFSAEICAGATISVVQYLTLLRYASLIAKTRLQKQGLNPTQTCLNSLFTRCSEAYERNYSTKNGWRNLSNF
jgi:hypothetical protein